MGLMEKQTVEMRQWLALSHAQRGVWLDMKLIGDPAAYQLGALTTIKGDVDPDLARQAVRLIMGRHDALRLRVDAEEPRQWFEAGGKPPFRLVDLSSASDPDAALKAHIGAAQAQGFALGEAPLFKVELIRLCPSDWRLMMLCHHLLADGVSIALAQRHWLQAYNTLCGETDDDGMPAEPAPRSSYLPVIADDETYFASDRYAEDLTYWRKRLSPVPALLFEDRPRVIPVAQDVAPDPVTLDPAAFARFEAAARAVGATTHRALISILAVALSRRYGKTDFTIGMALHRRDHATRHVIGMLAGMIAVRCRIDAGTTLDTAVERLSAEIDADLRHQRTPIDALGRALAATDPGAVRSGLFDVAVTIMPPARDAMPTLGGLPVVSTPLRGPENTALTLFVKELPDRGGLSIEFGFNPSVLTAAEVSRLRDNLCAVIAAFAAGEPRRLSSFDVLTPGERRQIDRWSHGTVIPVPEATLTDLFEARVAAEPDALAAVSDLGRMTFAALDAAANRVAWRIREAGVEARSVIGVALSRSIESVIAILGVLKAGCVYLPLDPAYPDARLTGMIENAEARAILTDADTAPRLSQTTPAILIDAGWPAQGDILPPPDRTALSPTDRAYVIYTSGSTGRPKGVAVSHRAAVNLAFARLEHDPIGPGDRVLAALSIGFDVSVGQLLTPLLSGATVIIADDIRGLSASAFWDILHRHGVTHVNAGPALIDSVLDEAPEGLSLKQVMLGGEPLSGLLASRIKARLGVPVFNMYGPTETCIDATAYAAAGEGIDRMAVLPIGRPLPNYSVHVLDAALKPVGIGTAGELFIGGPGLADGYLGLPQITAERFLDLPGHGRLYRTGDRVLWQEDGMLAFLGRADAQVKIRGFRVELGEIEAALAEHPALAQTAVITRPDSRGELRLLAYVTLANGAPTPESAALRAHLERQLPAHMIPSAFTVLAALPLTPNQKLDLRALPEPEAAGMIAGTPPRTKTERLLADGFCALLGLASVDIEGHFFELGGHSLLATQLASRLRAEIGIELPIRTLFEAPRIVDLAPRIDALIAAMGQATESGRLALVARARPEHLPMSFAQERLWFLSRLDPMSPAYNIPTVLRLDGALDVAAFKAALSALIDRHESLRTRFAEIDGEPVQIVLPARDLPFGIEDLADGQAHQVFARAEAEARRPFDLERDCLIRVCLLRLGKETHIALVTLHHIVSDGWSTGVLVRDMAAFYHAALADHPVIMPPLAIQYADYALWQRRMLDGGEMVRQTAFWKTALADAPELLALPTDFSRTATQSFVGASQALRLPAPLSQAINRLAKAQDATPFIVLLAAWASLLSRWSGQDDIVIGAPIANRTRAETEGLIGFFVNTIALRADLSGAPSFATMIDRLKARALDAYAHQDLPFEKLVDALRPKRDLGHHPLFQTMFVLNNTPSETLTLPGLALSPVAMPEGAAKFDLTLTLSETATGFAGAITYATDLFSPATMTRLAGQFQRLIEAVAAHPERPVERIPLLSPDERRQLLADTAPVHRPVEIDTIPALFERQVARTPDAPAVVFDGATLSFADLDRRANRLAHTLIARGVGPERAVGVALPRSEALVVAALAVMKAGGVYLPLDPAHPTERLAGMLDDAQAVLVITDGPTRGILPETMPVLDLGDAETGQAPDHAPTQADRLHPLNAETLAYLIYTSGSTGRPKGVSMSHAALAHLAGARLAHDPIGPGDRVLAALSVGFDVSVGQLVTPLLSGAAVVVTGELSTMTGAEFWALLAREAITHVNSGPAFLDAVLDSQPPVGLALTRLMLGGEPFSTQLARKIRAVLPKTEMLNMYGPTEACIDATAYRFTGAETDATLPIGRALPNYRVQILDRAMEPVGPGHSGEIHIGGPSLARGYLGQPELTAERFVADPFGTDGERLYRTGDMARLDANGQIVFLGRIDAQVKIRGFRIELGEIEAALRGHPGVASATIVTRARQGETAIVAYVVLGAREQPLSVDLRQALAAILPKHMIPSAIVVLDALPMTLNGKLDIKALPAPDAFEAALAAPTPPRHGLDAALQEIWRKVLNHDRIGIDDNFFEAGGHSLMALRLVAACKARLDLEFPVGTLFRHQTIRSFADAAHEGRLGGTGPLVPLGGAGDGRPLFCIHPVGGSVFGYAPLAEALQTTRPVFGLQAQGLEPGETPAASLAEMADTYLRAIRRQQPSGPYSLIGHSFGGLVAFEIARQLEAAGETVESLVLLDTSIPDAVDGVTHGTDQARVLLQAERSGTGAGALDVDQARRIEAVITNNIRLATGYEPALLEASLTYVQATRHGGDDGRAAFWGALSRRPCLPVAMDCGHFDMLYAKHTGTLLKLIGATAGA